MTSTPMQESRVKRFFKRIEKFFASCKQRVIVRHLLSHGGEEVMSEYFHASLADSEVITETSPVWICWWQGKEAMPDIAKACYNSVLMHADSHPVILITEKNYRDYVTLPAFIVEKQQNGEIDLTHFSDILRMMLLRQYGGIWMDSTVLLPAKSLNEFISPSSKFWSCHHLPIYNNILRGGWTSFFLACGKGNPLPAFIADMHLSYWKVHRKLVDYLLLDYTFAIGRAHIPAIHQMIEEVPITVMGPLGKCLNQEYTEEKWNEFCTNYDFHKLTYKIPLSLQTPEGKKTFYGYIIETYLNK